MRRLRIIAPLAVLALLTACASSGQSSGTRRSTNLITPEEWQGQSVTTALDAVRRLRPGWLQPRGQTGLPSVFRNNTRWGDDPRSLETLLLTEIAEIRFMNGPDATTRFGTGYPGGIIQVIAN
ncbi:MAG: hypothetical protein O7I93_05625 [Gemmatimonadetes bacterium]|nr:hypothetical protein [Gemmatimonadota bacterium]